MVNHSHPTVLSLIIVSLIAMSCTFVKLKPGAEDIHVAENEDVIHCELKGRSTVSLRAKIAGIKRSRKTVARELVILGKNSAVRLEGNVIVPASDIVDGEQVFEIYVCEDSKN